MSCLWMLIASSLVITVQSQSVGKSCVTPDGKQGTCGSVLTCPSLRALLVSVGLGNVQFSVFRRYICDIGKEPFVCCPDGTPNNPLPAAIPPRPISPNTPSPSIPQSGSSLLPTRCGIRGLVDRVIHGQPAPLGAWPWMVALRGRFDDRSTWHCGGTLISDRYVLTAAHCLDKRFGIELEFVRVGEHTFRRDPDCDVKGCAPQPQDIRAEQIIIHPSYDSPCKECNDIALLRLETKVNADLRYVQPICLPVNPEVDMGYSVEEFQGKIAWAAGWGTISKDPRSVITPDLLQQVQLPLQRLPMCERTTQSFPDQNMILCAGGDGRDTCRGDSGGPLTLTNQFSTKHFLIGITSKGPSICGTAETQGIYTSIHHYISWITSNMRP